jgi:putative FmdB family regulatory protein
MPVYEYRCKNCGEQVEVLVRSKSTLPTCPNCGSPRLEKLLSVPYVMSGERRSHGRFQGGRTWRQLRMPQLRPQSDSPGGTAMLSDDLSQVWHQNDPLIGEER